MKRWLVRAILLLVGCAFLGPAGFGFWTFYLRERKIEDVAVPITSLKPGYASYFWSADGRIILIYELDRGVIAKILDPSRHTATPLNAFNTVHAKQLSQVEEQEWIGPPGNQITRPSYYDPHPFPTPDGRRLLWCDRHTHPPQWVLASLDGRHTETWPGGERDGFSSKYGYDTYDRQVAWSPDGIDWVEGESCIVHERSTTPIFKIPQPALPTSWLGIPERNHLLGVSTSDPTYPMNYRLVSQAVLHDVAFGSTKPITHDIPVWLPSLHTANLPFWVRLLPGFLRPKPSMPSTSICSIILSPQADRIAWMLMLVDLKAPRNRRNPPTTRVGLWISNRNGEDWHEIGRFPIHEMDKDGGPLFNSPDDPDPRTLRWTVDGKRLSYIIHDVLYTVPAG